MSRWRIDHHELTEDEHSFSASFTCTNVGTGKVVAITLGQAKGDPASDLVGACRALAQLFVRVGNDEPLSDETNTQKLN